MWVSRTESADSAMASEADDSTRPLRPTMALQRRNQPVRPPHPRMATFAPLGETCGDLFRTGRLWVLEPVPPRACPNKRYLISNLTGKRYGLGSAERYTLSL
jgi:hypothetical protein